MLPFAFAASLIFVFTLLVYHDTRTPMDTRVIYKYRVKDNSIFRRIIPFKDKPYYPCCYLKVVPIYIYFCIALLGWLFFAMDVLGEGIITKIVTANVQLVMIMAVVGVYFLYFISVTIWWGIIDYKLTRFTEEEKAEFKNLRKTHQERKHKQ